MVAILIVSLYLLLLQDIESFEMHNESSESCKQKMTSQMFELNTEDSFKGTLKLFLFQIPN